MCLITQFTSLDTSSMLLKRFPRSGFLNFGEQFKVWWALVGALVGQIQRLISSMHCATIKYVLLAAFSSAFQHGNLSGTAVVRQLTE
jgi:hypothetical protein